jgi:Holliday junction resolvase RusA-like endonuclease
MIEFVVPGDPVAKGRPRAFRTGAGIGMHTPLKTVTYENLVRFYCALAAASPLIGALSAEIIVVLPVPQSWSNKRRTEALVGFVHPTKRPDTDNYLKSALDGMNGVAYADDSQVVRVSIEKRYGDQPRMMIRVTEIGGSA